MPGLRKIKEILEGFIAKYPRLRERKKLQLTYVAVKRLRERGEEVTLENVVEEARKIIKESDNEVSWGISADEYTEEIAAPLLHELAEIGAIELEPELLQEIAKRLRRGKAGEETPTPIGVSVFTKPV
ncbi:hypothetical protein PYJP_01720 [Pyrofollis japonicus]|uniref:hypothetical protein n=1 Tax=Pyrofollis japonicus TaxID=3060460 RepID=UPI00295BA895|nr:hypothetical protein [Pyrofollis japonicus]BEP16820.1 hypothetical protein PYJP_01720 [Pyrofollis japonicus]